MKGEYEQVDAQSVSNRSHIKQIQWLHAVTFLKGTDAYELKKKYRLLFWQYPFSQPAGRAWRETVLDRL